MREKKQKKSAERARSSRTELGAITDGNVGGET